MESIKILFFLSLILPIFCQSNFKSIYERYARIQGFKDHTDDSKLNKTEKNQQFVERFEQYMANMDPENVVIFELAAGERKVFNINGKGILGRIIGAYSVSGGDQNKITFSIFLPNNTLGLIRSKKKDVIFSLPIDLQGDYILEFINRNVFFDSL